MISGKFSNAWPTSMNSGEIGFDRDQGIVALAVTVHPDFDDAAGGGRNRDVWHPNEVVLAEDKACGGGLKVIDIPAGTTPKVPETLAGVPLLIDSPDYPTTPTGDAVDMTIPLALIGPGRALARHRNSPSRIQSVFGPVPDLVTRDRRRRPRPAGRRPP